MKNEARKKGASLIGMFILIFVMLSETYDAYNIYKNGVVYQVRVVGEKFRYKSEERRIVSRHYYSVEMPKGRELIVDLEGIKKIGDKLNIACVDQRKCFVAVNGNLFETSLRRLFPILPITLVLFAGATCLYFARSESDNGSRGNGSKGQTP